LIPHAGGATRLIPIVHGSIRLITADSITPSAMNWTATTP
jgi:hypothetical protein